jgi:hypothetical protein
MDFGYLKNALFAGCSKSFSREAIIVRDREIRTTTNSQHELELKRADQAQRSGWRLFQEPAKER